MKKPEPKLDVSCCTIHGWMLPGLLSLDDMMSRRWSHWCDCMEAKRIVGDKIPPIKWNATSEGRKVWEKMLDATVNYGGWRGWSSWRNVDFLFDWLLHGLHHPAYTEPPKEIDEFKGATQRIAEVMNVGILLRDPHDYIGDILAENEHGRHRGFFPTPMPVADMMAMMMFGDVKVLPPRDCREKTVLDPAVGSGRLLLAASNHSYRLYGVDIDGTIIKACLINGYFYAPWLVKPFPFLDGANMQAGNSVFVSDSMAEQCPAQLEGTEADPDAYKWEPIKKRRRTSAAETTVKQGVSVEATTQSG